MKVLLRLLLSLFVIVFIISLQFATSQLLPFPLNKINVIFGSIVLMLLLTRNGVLVWMSFFLHYLVELYATIPFGVVLFSGTMTTLVLYWISREVFSSAKMIIVLGMGLVSIIIYRFFYTVTLVFANAITHNTAPALNVEILSLYGWEVLFTTGFIALLYLILPTRIKNHYA